MNISEREGRLNDSDESASMENKKKKVVSDGIENSPSESGITAWLQQQSSKRLLRFLTCGSVDDGKSTLVGRLLYDANLVLSDELSKLKLECQPRSGKSHPIDFSLLVDGLSAEREQGITIDVAYRFFDTKKRKFVLIDAPGHEQYTRNMVTGASNAQLAVLTVDARKGLQPQTHCHAYILSLIGVRQVLLAINKMDLVDYSEAAFHHIRKAFSDVSETLGLDVVAAIPVSALKGDNIVERSANTMWYSGAALLTILEDVEISDDRATKPMRFPVQWVNRPHQDFRGYSGTLASGAIAVGSDIVIAPSQNTAKVARIVTMDGDRKKVSAGEAVTLVLDREIDISRGDIFAKPGELPECSDQFQARIIWMYDEPAYPGRSYFLQLGTQMVSATITNLKYRTNIKTLDNVPATRLHLNEIGTVTIATAAPIAFDSFSSNATTGSFILIDRLNNATVGVGLIDFGLRRAQNLTYQSFDVDRKVRSDAKGQTAQIVWLTGLSGSGKSTVANLLEKRLTSEGRHCYILDGDNVRHGLNKDLGFTNADRVENIRRIAELARLMADAGLIVIVSFISPFTNERRLAREIAADIEFHEVHVDTPISVCEARDPKGLYAKARRGEIKNFTGLDSPYEAPKDPDLVLDGSRETPEQMMQKVYDVLV